MNKNRYLKITIAVVLLFYMVGIGCGEPDDIYDKEDCTVYYDLNLRIDTLYLFDYENTDKLVYKRTTGSVIDTLIFTIVDRKTDSIHKNSSDFGCEPDDIYFERRTYSYRDKVHDKDYIVEWTATASHEDFGGFVTARTNEKAIVGNLGWPGIGNKESPNYQFEYVTSTGTFYNTWFGKSGFFENSFYIDVRGNVYGDYDTTCSSVYSPLSGRIELSFDNGEEIWELLK